jgi:uncharacterized membrane protein
MLQDISHQEGKILPIPLYPFFKSYIQNACTPIIRLIIKYLQYDSKTENKKAGEHAPALQS